MPNKSGNKKSKTDSKLKPTIDNLEKIQKSFDKARVKMKRKKSITKDDFRGV